MTETSRIIEGLLDDEKPTLITGDFNVCYRQNANNVISSCLMQKGFIQMVEKATQVMGGLIDHAYWRDNYEHWEMPVIEQYSPYYSDHDAILVTLQRM